LAVVLGIVVLGIGIWAINPYPVGALHDDAVYVILAKSLATGQGYRYLNLPGAPAASHFPPGYPVFLSLLWRLWPTFPNNVLLFKFANAALLVAGYWALGRLLRRHSGLSGGAAWITAAIAMASVPMLFVSTLLLSETLFLVVVLVALGVGQRLFAENATTRDAVVAGAVFGLATLVRVPGIALVAAAGVCLLIRRRPRDATVVFVAAVIVLLPWQIWSGRHARDVPLVLQAAYGSYTGWVGDGLRHDGVRFLVRTVAGTTRQSFDLLIDAVAPFGSSAVRLLVAAAFLVTAVVGARLTWRRMPLVAGFLVFYFVIVLAFPWPPARYVWGMWPLLLVVPALAVQDTVVRRRWTLAVITAIPVLGYTWYSIVGYADRDWLRIPASAGAMMRPIVGGVRTHIPPDGVAAVTAEAAVHLYTQRRTTPIYSVRPDEFLNGVSLSAQTDAIDAIVSAYPVGFIVVSTPLQRAAVESLRTRRPGAIVLADSFPGSVIYRVNRLPPDPAR
jgi:hypothetical protein